MSPNGSPDGIAIGQIGHHSVRAKSSEGAAMRMIVGGVALAAWLVACSPDDATNDLATKQDTAAFASAAPEQLAPEQRTNIIPPQSDQPPPAYVATDMTPTDSTPQCRAGLRAKGATEAELNIVLGPMAGVCPNTGVDEGRIREILMRDWIAAGCRQHTPIEVARALDSGACGGDAG
jgi:hypothetical protein